MSVPPNPGPDPEPIPATDVAAMLTAAEYAGVHKSVLDNNLGMAGGLAARIVDEALRFVTTAAQRPGAVMAPSRVVDEGWHALILHTRLYGPLCAQFGRFVHHTPGYDPTNYDPQILERTQALIGAAGFTVDEGLWHGPTDDLIAVAAKCQHAPECAIQPMPTPQKPGIAG